MSAVKIVPLTLAERAARLEWLYGIEKVSSAPGLYSLKSGETGGRNPAALTPFAACEDGRQRADCTGVAMWGQGIDRYQSESRFPLYGGWINTDSMLMDALSERTITGSGGRVPKRAMFREVHEAQPGHLIVYPAVYDQGVKAKGSIGHVVTVVEVRCTEWPGLAAAAGDIIVVHCHGGRIGRTKRAVDRTTLRSAMGTSVKRAHILLMHATP